MTSITSDRPPSDDSLAAQRWRLAPWLLVAVTVLAAASSLGNGFVYDDVAAIVENPRAHDPTDLTAIFARPYWTSTLYRPLTTWGFSVLWVAGSGSPLPFHLANVALKVVVTLLLWILMRRLGARDGPALLGALVFAVHPVHSEVVANGVGLAELLSATAIVWACVLVTRREADRPSMLVPAVLILAAMLAKESGVTALALVPLCLVASGPPTARAGWRPVTELVALSALFIGAALVVRLAVLGTLGGEVPAIALEGLSDGGRLWTVVGVVPEWARLLAWPAALQADYGPPQLPLGFPGIGRVLLASVIVSILVLGCLWAVRHRRHGLWLGLAWIPVAISPVSNILFPTGIVLAERTLFLASIGACLALACILDALPATVRKGAVGVVVLGIALGGARTFSRMQVWAEPERFFRQMVVDAEQSYRAWFIAARHADGRGDTATSRVWYEQAWTLYQGDFRVAEELGQTRRVAGDLAGAAEVLRAGYALRPLHEPLTSRLLEVLMTAERWEEAAALVNDATTRNASDGARLGRRLRERHEQTTSGGHPFPPGERSTTR